MWSGFGGKELQSTNGFPAHIIKKLLIFQEVTEDIRVITLFIEILNHFCWVILQNVVYEFVRLNNFNVWASFKKCFS